MTSVAVEQTSDDSENDGIAWTVGLGEEEPSNPNDTIPKNHGWAGLAEDGGWTMGISP